MRNIREILRLRHERGLSLREISRACGTGASTVSSYLERAEEVGLGWPLPEEMDDGVLEGRLFPVMQGGGPLREPPDLGWVHRELRRPGVTLTQLWLEYAEGKEEAYRYSRFCEIYRQWMKKLHPSMRQVHRAGEKGFVDFAGKHPHYVEPASGEEVEAELFVGVLGASSRTYARAVASQELPLWIEAHVRMFEEWGGAPWVLVPDNLKSGVTTASRYDPEVNRTYAEMAAHYGAVVVPARPARPRDKAKAEAGVLCAERAILGGLRNQTFVGLAALNEGIDGQLDWLNNRPMKRLGKSRMELFEELDRPALRPLPASRYEMAIWKVCRVNIDYHVEADRNLYSVPYSLLHEQVEARLTATTVEVFHRSRRVASHKRLYGRGEASTQPEHMPRSHRAHAEWTPSRILSWAGKMGPATERVAGEILRDRPHPEHGFRACLGLLRLGKSYGEDRLEAACRRAERARSFRYQTVKNILRCGLDRQPLAEDDPTNPPVPRHENLRGADYFTKEDTRC